ncbi:hypothetical protein F4780DRAFT_401218 [Xylariomycetidae sp. FL0641]|nr:hypothetical protein F4780DRAFT_401218 [Xylariomycetidae sp. FL0641]
MDLTPIKIRGKRRRRGEPPANVLPVAKRPKAKATGIRKKAKPRASQVSYIEKEIPLEVLERIFWFSENVNLPRASLRFGRLLSGVSTLRETFIQAFGPTWEVWYGCVRDPATTSHTVHSYTGWEQDFSRFGGNPEFQSALLEYSWTDISLILACWDIWVRRCARNRPFEYVQLWETPKAVDQVPGTTDVSPREPSSYFWHDWNAFRQIESQNPPEAASYFQNERPVATWIEVHRNTRIPDALLTGPWDEPALQKLFWLVRAGSQLSADQTWEVTLEGFHNAIAETASRSDNINLTVVRLFSLLGIFTTWPNYVGIEELEKVHRIRTSQQISREIDNKYAYIQTRLSNFADP